jgi:LysR family transcriptional regulator of gallate degradation
MRLIDAIKPLRAACAVAVCGSSVRAAQALHVSQSSITRAVVALEAHLQQSLFYRSSLGMQKIPAFAAILNRCMQAFDLLAISHSQEHTHRNLPRWMGCRVAMSLGARHIRVMLSLSATGSETLSAKQLGISQSAVHQTLAQLEHLCTQGLFARSSTSGLKINATGAALLQGCKAFVSELQQADEMLAALTGQLQGRLVIGTLPFSTGALLPKALDRLLELLPGVQVTVIDGTYEALMQQLRHGDIDIMLGALRPELAVKGVVQEKLFVDRLAVMARTAHPLAKLQGLSWRDMHNTRWIMPMANTPAQHVLDDVFSSSGLPMPAVELRVNSALVMQALLLQSDRVAMMSPRQLHIEMSTGLLAELPLPLPRAERTIGMVHRAEVREASALAALIDTCRFIASEFMREIPDK